jgi:predicted glycoside hydrolase/deacetylase ChbG (UPF0249 family)
MVFMRNSERAAEAALEAGLDVGLHLNFTQKLTGLDKRSRMEDFHKAVSGFLARTRTFPLYNPLLRRQFEYVYHAQLEEFLRLYGMKPSHVDGHKHMHLCANMIMDRVIPARYPVRRSFHFFRGEKGVAKRLYRWFLNGWVSRNFVSTDYFFDLRPMFEERLLRIISISRNSNVELMVHPEMKNVLEYLLSNRFCDTFQEASMGTWRELGLGKEETAAPVEADRIGMDMS